MSIINNPLPKIQLVEIKKEHVLFILHEVLEKYHVDLAHQLTNGSYVEKLSSRRDISVIQELYKEFSKGRILMMSKGKKTKISLKQYLIIVLKQALDHYELYWDDNILYSSYIHHVLNQINPKIM